jgi:hypothetical protein
VCITKLLARSVGSLACAAMLLAADGASISSAQPFVLRGNSVNVEGVPSWRITAGDEIGTPSGDAVIQLRSGSRVAVLKGSRVRMEEDAGGSILRVLSGSVRILSASPEFRVFLNNDLANALAGQTLSVGTVAAQATASTSGSLSPNLAPRAPRPVSSR